MRYARGESRQADILRHLDTCDGGFFRRLSERVDLNYYASKLVSKAHRVEAWNGAELVGLVAIYVPSGQPAFVTNVSVSSDRQRRGIARHLLQQAIADARAAGCPSIELEVNAKSVGALKLYASFGFEHVSMAAGEGGEILRLCLDGPNRTPPR